uniref:DDE Tnp4 domain-containing protein n=1 Tax=Setaria viridis TaxID=4556 RepID=A0A4V6DCA8_SETVI|nr:hypothetical protein SEVIR_3G051200v2 [Setaria viridis]
MPEIDWNSENTRVLCTLFAEQVGKENRPNIHLNALVYAEFKKKVLENEDELAKCFADITTIGIDHWSPHVVNVEAKENVDETQDEATNFEPQDDDFVPETQDEDISISPPPTSGKRLARSVERSGKKAKSGSALLIQEAVTNPNFRNAHKRIRNDKRAYPHFKDCIGAVDGTHIRVSLSPEEQVRYIGKTRIATQNVLAVCDFDMRFTYVAADQPGSLHNTMDFANFDKDPTYVPTIPESHYASVTTTTRAATPAHSTAVSATPAPRRLPRATNLTSIAPVHADASHTTMVSLARPVPTNLDCTTTMPPSAQSRILDVPPPTPLSHTTAPLPGVPPAHLCTTAPLPCGLSPRIRPDRLTHASVGPLVPPPYGEASARPMKLLPEPNDEDESDDRRLEQPPPSPPHVGEAATAATLGNGPGSGRGGLGIRPRWHGRVPPAPVGEAAAAAPGDGSSLVGMVACRPMAAPSDIPSGCGRQEMKRGSRPPCRHHPREPRRRRPAQVVARR